MADCCYDLIAWQVRNRLIPQPLVRTQEMSWMVLGFFLCIPGNNFLLWILCDLMGGGVFLETS